MILLDALQNQIVSNNSSTAKTTEPVSPTGVTMSLPTKTPTAPVTTVAAAGAVEVVATAAAAAMVTLPAAVVVLLLAVLAMASGETESTSLALPTLALNASSSALSMIPPSSKLVSTSRSTTTSLSRLPVQMCLRLFTSSPLLLWMSTCAATSSLLTTRSPLLFKNIRSPLSWVVVI